MVEIDTRDLAEGMGGNYAAQAQAARDIFMTLDQENIIEKLGLAHDEQYIYLPMMDECCRISRREGYVEVCPLSVFVQGEAAAWQECRSFETVMTVYDVLGYSKEGAHLAGDFCPVTALQVTGVPSPDKLYGKYYRSFAGKAVELKRACEAIGGEMQSIPASADVNYRMALFPFLPMIFQFWDEDDEFPPQVSLLWDRNVMQYIHFETIYYVMYHVLERIKTVMEREN